MNAITYWLTEHFSLITTPATFERVGEFSLIEFSASWWADECYAVHIALVGIALDFAYWPNGKYADTDEAGA